MPSPQGQHRDGQNVSRRPRAAVAQALAWDIPGYHHIASSSAQAGTERRHFSRGLRPWPVKANLGAGHAQPRLRNRVLRSAWSFRGTSKSAPRVRADRRTDRPPSKALRGRLVPDTNDIIQMLPNTRSPPEARRVGAITAPHRCSTGAKDSIQMHNAHLRRATWRSAV